MRAFLTGLICFGLFFIFGRWYFVCETRGNCAEQVTETLPPPRDNSLFLTHNADTIAGPFDQFLYPAGEINPTLNDSNEKFLDALTKFLKDSSAQKVMIIGKYGTDESEMPSGFFENLGIARAAGLEKLLENRGIDQKRIETAGSIASPAGRKIPLSFRIIDPAPVADTKFDIPQYRFEDNTFSDANFEFGSAEFRPGFQLVTYADSVKQFLDINPDYVLTIIGHTDSIDTEEFNQKLGMERAESAKSYFEELGITSSINTVSMGEKQPVAPNTNPDGSDNEQGRQANRRVNFKLNTQDQ